MFDVTKIDLKEVFKKYFGLVETDFEREGKTIMTKCPFHGDTNPSLKIYTEKDSPDFYCYACKAAGNAINALVKGGIVDNEDAAVDKLMTDFNLRLPSYVDVETFAALKGLDVSYLTSQGWKNEGDKLAIPYYNENMELKARKVRTKYTGKNKYFYESIPGADNTTYYGLNKLSKYSDSAIYFTEGETDQVTLGQAEYPAIGIPSTNAWKSERSHMFTRFKRHIVVRDTDKAGAQLVQSIAKDFPASTYYIQLPGKTKDINNFWNYIVNKDAAKFKEFMNTVKLWPATPEAFKQGLLEGLYTNAYDLGLWEIVISHFENDIEVKVFIEELSDAITTLKKQLLKDVAKEAKDKHTTNASVIDMKERYIYPSGNAYFKDVFKKGSVIPVQISNFVIKLHSVVEHEGKCARYTVFTNENGETSAPIALEGQHLTNVGAFRALCLDMGGFSFTGSDRDLAEITLSLIDQAKDMNKIEVISKVGHINNHWVFGNAAIDSKGTIANMDAEGVISLGGKQYMLTGDNISDDTASLPTINTARDTGMDLNDIKRKLAYSVKGAYGTYSVWNALGWAVSGWYSDMIFKKYTMYPLMFLFGKRNSGKSTLASSLMEFFGFDGMMSAISAESTSRAALSKALGTHYSLPVWLDDYRNNSVGSQAKNSLLLNTYNRHGSTKGIPNSQRVRKEPINGFVLLSGEDSPQDNALASRCIVVEVASNKNDMVKFKEFQALQLYFKDLGLEFCINSTSKDKQLELVKRISDIQGKLVESGIDTRLATNTAVFAAAFLLEFEEVLTPGDVENYLSWVAGGASVNKQDIEDNHVINIFWNDIGRLIEKGYVTKNDHYVITEENGKSYVAFRMDPTYMEWSRYNQELAKQWSGNAIKTYIKNDSYFVEDLRVTVNGMRHRRLKLDMERLKVYSMDLYEVLKSKCKQDDEPEF